jgi:hypothetical protein
LNRIGERIPRCWQREVSMIHPSGQKQKSRVFTLLWITTVTGMGD